MDRVTCQSNKKWQQNRQLPIFIDSMVKWYLRSDTYLYQVYI